MTIVEFLEARIAEDERQAMKHLKNASASGWGSYPAHILAECKAKREILSKHAMLVDQSYRAGGDVAGYHATGLRIALRILAAVYDDHRDYRAEWAA